MIHLDLFSGIGGFAIAVDKVWPGTEHIFCEIDPYCQTLLKLRYPGAKIYGDIRELRLDTYTDSNGRTGRKEEVNTAKAGQQAQRDVEECSGQLTADTESAGFETRNSNPMGDARQHKRIIARGNQQIFLLTGGFPCQPFSQAGKRRGTEDNRYLWPEMLRVIREFQPAWVIAENVRGLLTINEGMVFEQVCADLEAEGYEVQPLIIPACAVNAPHRRDRVWFVANRTSNRQQRRGQSVEAKEGLQPRPESAGQLARGFEGPYSHAPDTGENATHSVNGGLPGKDKYTEGEDGGYGIPASSSWSKNWLEVATELCRVDDGLPAELDGLKLSKSKHRVERLKSLGNAIVPQVAFMICTAIRFSQEVNDHDPTGLRNLPFCWL